MNRKDTHQVITKHYAAGIGFACATAWIAFGFGDAILCLTGAALFAAATAFWQGELDLPELQDRIGRNAQRRRRT